MAEKITAIGAIDPTLHKAAKQYAAANETTLRNVVEAALWHYLPQPKKAGRK